MNRNSNSEKLESISVLYVEDDGIIRTALEKTLRRRITTLYVAEKGKAGLDAFRKYRPTLVISDISMPIMNGLEMCETIKAEDRTLSFKMS